MTAQKITAPYGTWESPITTDLLTQGAVGLGQIAVMNGRPLWTEARPAEAGRVVLVTAGNGDGVRDLLRPPHSIRSRVHEYGGGAFAAAGGSVWFVAAADQAVMRLDLSNGVLHRIFQREDLRWADLLLDESRQRLVAVAEDHAGKGEAVNRLMALGFDGGCTVLAEGADFYAAPRLSPCGTRLCWLQWSHPNMPWDGTELWEATLTAAGDFAGVRRVAGGADVSIFQPEYAPDGTLFYISDQSGFWNLYRDGEPPRQYEFAAEFGLPHWIFGMRTYGFLADGRIVCAHATQGDWRLGLLDPDSGWLDILDLPWRGYDALVCEGSKAWFVGGRADAPAELVELDVDSGQSRILRTSAVLGVGADSLSVAQAVQFPTGGGETAHAWYYPPASAAYEAPAGEKPPLIVKCHGGPTGQATADLSLKTQFWTSRGFAVLDVNYRGSTGFGRAYRMPLDGNWGLADVEDCLLAARHVAEQGLADPERLIISGSSAGGYTVLCALAFHDVFKAGCSLYGIGDLAALARDTHKFESRYTDRLVGRWPEEEALYQSRSPLFHTDRLNCPVLFLQGAEDQVVPPEQAESMVAALRQKGVPVAYLLFEGEGHGFRQGETIQRALQAELGFYGRIFGFAPAGDLAPLEIENL